MTAKNKHKTRLYVRMKVVYVCVGPVYVRARVSDRVCRSYVGCMWALKVSPEFSRCGGCQQRQSALGHGTKRLP